MTLTRLRLIRCLMALAIITFLVLPAHAQLLGTLTDAPQHLVGGGGGCDGNGQCSGDVFFADRIGGANYALASVELIPNLVPKPVPVPLGSSANQSVAGFRTTNVLNIKPVASTGDEQVVYQSGRMSVILGATGGAALPTPDASSLNLALGEHLTVSTRLNKTLNTDPGGTNWYAAMTVYFTQIVGLPNGQTWAIRLNVLHGSNGRTTAAAIRRRSLPVTHPQTGPGGHS